MNIRSSTEISFPLDEKSGFQEQENFQISKLGMAKRKMKRRYGTLSL